MLWYVAGNMAYMDTMPDLMSETVSIGTLGKQAEYDRRRRRKYVIVAKDAPMQHWLILIIGQSTDYQPFISASLIVTAVKFKSQLL